MRSLFAHGFFRSAVPGAGPPRPGPVTARLLDVSLNPSVNSLPGGGVLQRLTNGVGGWALIAALVGMVVGAGAWALGSHTQNYHQSFSGRRTVLVSGLAARADRRRAGAGELLLHAGQTVH